MSTIKRDIIGWDLVYDLIKEDIRDPQDILFGLIHLILLNKKYRIKGSDNEQPTELLPTNWNRNPSFYVVTYIDPKYKNIYELQTIIPCEDIMVVNCLRKNDVKVSTVHFKLTQYVKTLRGTLEEMIPKYRDIIRLIEMKFVEKTDIDKHFQFPDEWFPLNQSYFSQWRLFR